MSNKNQVWHSPVASAIPTDSGDSVQEELDKIVASASPGYSFGRSGTTPNGTWMLRPGGSPSNKTGITIGFTNPIITNVTVANENISTFDITVYEHDGDEVNLTILGTVSVVAARGDEFSVSFSATKGKQLATRVTSGSAKNPGVDLQLSGTV